MPNEPHWLPIEAVIEHNRLELAEAGERHLVAMLVFSKARWHVPRNFYGFGQEDIVTLAVALIAGIARAHAFEQGNKRTAFGVLRLFQRANGYDTAFDDTISWAEEIIALVEHRSSEEDFVRAVRPFVVATE